MRRAWLIGLLLAAGCASTVNGNTKEPPQPPDTSTVVSPLTEAATLPAAAPGPTVPAPAATTTSLAPGVLLAVSGSGTKSTQTFRVTTGDWDVRWSYQCGADNTPLFQIYVKKNGQDDQVLSHPGPSGSDIDYYHDGPGTFFLQIESDCPWTVTVTGP